MLLDTTTCFLPKQFRTPCHVPTMAAPELTELLSKLTLEEKVSLLSGADGRQTQEIPRLGIGSLKVPLPSTHPRSVPPLHPFPGPLRSFSRLLLNTAPKTNPPNRQRTAPPAPAAPSLSTAPPPPSSPPPSPKQPPGPNLPCIKSGASSLEKRKRRVRRYY